MQQNQERTFASSFWNRVQLVFIWPCLIVLLAIASLIIIPLIGIFANDDVVEKTLEGSDKIKKKPEE